MHPPPQGHGLGKRSRKRASTIQFYKSKGGPLSDLLMTGNIATRYPDETLAYDPGEGRVLNKAEANEYPGFDYRTGWTL